jgi:hypothetical protein
MVHRQNVSILGMKRRSTTISKRKDGRPMAYDPLAHDTHALAYYCQRLGKLKRYAKVELFPLNVAYGDRSSPLFP